jgi:hypothetical protein
MLAEDACTLGAAAAPLNRHTTVNTAALAAAPLNRHTTVNTAALAAAALQVLLWYCGAGGSSLLSQHTPCHPPHPPLTCEGCAASAWGVC